MKKKNEHDHKLTKLLKVSIFALIMLAPFFAIVSKVGYVMLNKNAKESYSGSFVYLTTTKYNSYITNKNIPFVSYTDNTYTNYTISSTSFNNINLYRIGENTNIVIGGIGFNCNSIIVNGTEYTDINSVILFQTDRDVLKVYTYSVTLDTNYFMVRNTWDSAKLYYQGVEITPINNINRINTIHENVDICASLSSNIIYCSNNDVINGILTYSNLDIYLNDTSLSSVFYSAIQELDKASIFSWTTETGLYTAVNNMCTNLGIDSPPLAVLITYWTLITIIYVIIDIVLEAFIYLTHWLNDRML